MSRLDPARHMPGQIKRMIDRIIEERTRKSPAFAHTTRTKLMLKGIIPDRYGADSPDDPRTLEQLRMVASELGIAL